MCQSRGVVIGVFHNDCLYDKRQNYQNCSVLCRVRQLCAMVRIVDSDGPKEAQVQLYSPGGANGPRGRAHWRHLTNTIEPSISGLVSNYFDHLLVFVLGACDR